MLSEDIVNNILSNIDLLSVKDLVSLTEELKKKYNITGNVGVSTGGKQDDAVKDEKKEQSAYTIVFSNIINASKKITIIKEIKTLEGIGLGAAKTIVDDLGNGGTYRTTKIVESSVAKKLQNDLKEFVGITLE